jgi:hypothetical protein
MIAVDSLSDRLQVPGGYYFQTFLFKIDGVKSGDWDSELILVNYMHLVGKSMDKVLFNPDTHLSLNLQRRQYCDAKISDFDYKDADPAATRQTEANTLRPLPGMENEFGKIPRDQSIRCYQLLKPGH